MKKSLFALCLCVPAAICLPARAELNPHGDWEKWGLRVGAVSVPAYRAAEVRSIYASPPPYLSHHGGLRAELFESGLIERDPRLSATLASGTDEVPRRLAWSGLKPVLGFGPSINLSLWRSADANKTLELRLPLQAGIAMESSPRHIGWLFTPKLKLNVQDPAGFEGWRADFQGGPLFGTHEYNGYFYSVHRSEATAWRPAYAAPGGYAGLQISTTLSKQFPRYWIGAFLRYDNLADAAYSDSPLMLHRDALSAGVAFTWVFDASSIKIPNVSGDRP